MRHEPKQVLHQKSCSMQVQVQALLNATHTLTYSCISLHNLYKPVRIDCNVRYCGLHIRLRRYRQISYK